jgi:hypothetical protein
VIRFNHHGTIFSAKEVRTRLGEIVCPSHFRDAESAKSGIRLSQQADIRLARKFVARERKHLPAVIHYAPVDLLSVPLWLLKISPSAVMPHIEKVTAKGER